MDIGCTVVGGCVVELPRPTNVKYHEVGDDGGYSRTRAGRDWHFHRPDQTSARHAGRRYRHP